MARTTPTTRARRWARRRGARRRSNRVGRSPPYELRVADGARFRGECPRRDGAAHQGGLLVLPCVRLTKISRPESGCEEFNHPSPERAVFLAPSFDIHPEANRGAGPSRRPHPAKLPPSRWVQRTAAKKNGRGPRRSSVAG